MLRSIRRRIAAPYAALILLSLLAVGLLLMAEVRQAARVEQAARLGRQTRFLAQSLASTLPDPPTSDTSNELARRWAEALGLRVTLYSAGGVQLADSTGILSQETAPPAEITAALANGSGSAARTDPALGGEVFYSAAAITINGQTRAILRLGEPAQNAQSLMPGLTVSLAVSAVLAAALALGLGTLIAGSITRPIRELTEAVARLSSDQAAGRLLPGGADEVGKLTQAFNLMAVQLQNQFEALEREQSKMAVVLAQMTDGVVIVDQNGLVALINPAAEDMFETPDASALGKSLPQVLRHHQLIDLWRRCRASGEAVNTTIEMNTRRLYLHCMAAPLGAQMPGSILLVIQNLTRLRHLETVRRDFISNISHELRTPLASLKALTETLQEGALDDPPAARRFLNRIETEVDALTHMVSELLELSRIESGKVPLQLKSTPPESILASALERLRVQAERAGLEVQLDCPPGLPEVLADAPRLEQVVVNLLHNAIKFTPSGGAVHLKARPADGAVIFSVEDTGVGIRADDLPRIFERFYKADRARSTGGTGLGLAISRHLVEAHSGQIWAESVEGQGSRFFFSVPTAA